MSDIRDNQLPPSPCPRGQLAAPLRRLRERGRLVVAASEPELRDGLRRGVAIDTRGVAELVLAAQVLEDCPARPASASPGLVGTDTRP